MNELMIGDASLDQTMKLAEIIANSNICPKEFKGKSGDVLVAIMMGAEIGLPPIQAIQGIAVINGRPTMWGDTLLAVVQASGLLEDINEVWDDENKIAHCHVARKNRTPQTSSFGFSDAKLAGLFGKTGPWKQYPHRMCKLRARAFALRDGFPDVLRGVHSTEEASDSQSLERDISPAEQSQKALAPTANDKAKAALEEAAVVTQVEETAILTAQEMIDAIGEATDDAKLKQLAMDVSSHNFDLEEMQKIRAVWKARSAELKGNDDGRK